MHIESEERTSNAAIGGSKLKLHGIGKAASQLIITKPRHNATIRWSIEFGDVVVVASSKCGYVSGCPVHINDKSVGLTGGKPDAPDSHDSSTKGCFGQRCPESARSREVC